MGGGVWRDGGATGVNVKGGGDGGGGASSTTREKTRSEGMRACRDAFR